MNIVLASAVALIMVCGQPLSSRGVTQDRSATLVQEIMVSLNTLRTNPSSFIPKLRAYRDYMRSRTKNLSALDAAITEATARLSSVKALPAINTNGGLLLAAQDHAADITKNAVMGHTGSNTSTPVQRVKKHSPITMIGEVVTYGFPTADLILASFIVDQDTPDRGHRENLLNAKYTMAGVAIGAHAKYGTACVIVLGGM